MRINQSEDRLLAWNQLRQDNTKNELADALININDWWQMLPIANHYLHWDDIDRWPNPWDLIADGIFCDLAKALGVVYTIHLLERDDITQIELAETRDGDKLVLVNQGKYILNWAPGQLLNNHTQTHIERTINSDVVTRKIH